MSENLSEDHKIFRNKQMKRNELYKLDEVSKNESSYSSQIQNQKENSNNFDFD